jgi:predicted nucleic-acid-binding Zn-ribbon protein
LRASRFKTITITLVIARYKGVNMKNGHCPKCNSTEVYRGAPATLAAGEGWVHLENRKTGTNIMLDSYVCANCGYVEMYVAEASKVKLPSLAEDKKFWQKVG